METWKQAYRLAKFEFNQSRINLLFSVAILILALIFVIPSLPSYFENSYLGFDLFFYIIFTMVFTWPRPKRFQSQKLRDDLWGSHFLVMLQHFPIRTDVIAKYRFLT